MIPRSKTFFIVSLLLIFILLFFVLIMIFYHTHNKKNSSIIESTTPKLKTVVPTSDDDPIPSSNEPQYDPNAYMFTKLFANQFPLRYVDSFGIKHTPTGNDQTIAIVSNVLSVWSARNIMKALTSCGITNKSVEDILSQVLQIDATTIEETFDYLHYRDLTVPLSNGLTTQVEYDDVKTESNILEVALQCLFTALPDVKVVIFYYGSNPSICPPDEDAAIDLYEDIIKKLFTVMESTPIFKIFCNNLIIDDHSGDLVDFVRTKIQNMTNKKIQVITTMGECDYEPGDVQEYETVPPGFSKVIRVGGLLRLFNTLPIVYENSNGGYFTIEDVKYERSTIPYGQVGYVTPTLPTSPVHDPDLQYVGCPDVAGFCDKIYAFLGNSDDVDIVKDICIAAYAYTAMIAMVNEISNETAWNYQRFFYRYHFYLFDYVNSGTNNIYNASDYRIWNPCSGLGQLNGNKLAALLSNKYILTGYPTQLTSLNITELMCYVNFFPLAPFTDPNNIPSLGGDYMQSQPAFGPQSIWSELFIYVVSQDPESGNMMIPRNYSNQIVQNRDIIVIVSSQSYSTAWALAYVNEQLQITTHNIRPGIPIPPEFLWTIDCAGGISEQYVRITTGVRLSPYLSNRHKYLTSQYRDHRSPSLLAKSSISNDYDNMSIVFSFVPHVYHLIKADYNDTTVASNKGIQKSYFINLTNKDDFITSGFTIEQSVIMGRDISSVSSHLPYVQFTREFDPVPQWLLIPAHSIHNQSDMNTGLTFGQYMIFNTRCQAYMYLYEDRYNPLSVRLININGRTAQVSKDIYNWAVFHVRSSDVQDSDVIFKPRGISIYPYNRINDFLSRVMITFEAPYYSNNSPFSYRRYLSFIPQTISYDGHPMKILQFVLSEPSENMYMFLIQRDYISTKLQDVYIKPAFVSDFNRRFSNCVISATNPNDYVGMIPYNTRDPKQKWECLATPLIKTISDTFDFLKKYPIIRFDVRDDDDRAGFQFQNYQYRDMFLIHCEGGWKPRLGYPCDDGMNWVFYANYFNAIPGNSKITLSGNYFYLNTVYYINCRRGVLSSSIDTSHLPGLLTQITRENNDTEYYGSSFIIFKN